MGALTHFDKMLPVWSADGSDPSKRQVEIVTWDNRLFLRVGELNQENSGENFYAVELSKETGPEFADSVSFAMRYLAWPAE